jgi:hypothetical protein
LPFLNKLLAVPIIYAAAYAAVEHVVGIGALIALEFVNGTVLTVLIRHPSERE